MKTGAELIAQERAEQIQKHGFTPERDRAYTDQELLQAAVSLLLLDETLFLYNGGSEDAADCWPENWNFDLFCKIESKDRIEQLQIAGALIAAEIDRLQYPQIEQAAAKRAKLVQEFAAKLNGREYGEEMSNDERKQAKRDGLIMICGASDDLMEVNGALEEELGAYPGVSFVVAINGVLNPQPYIQSRGTAIDELPDVLDWPTLDAVWNDKTLNKHYAWSYRTEIPHATFDVMDGDDGSYYCRGIVFHIDDVLETALKIKARRQA